MSSVMGILVIGSGRVHYLCCGKISPMGFVGFEICCGSLLLPLWACGYV